MTCTTAKTIYWTGIVLKWVCITMLVVPLGCVAIFLLYLVTHCHFPTRIELRHCLYELGIALLSLGCLLFMGYAVARFLTLWETARDRRDECQTQEALERTFNLESHQS